MKQKYLLILCCFTILYSPLSARNKKLAVIPFKLLNSYVLVETRINQTAPLQLIYDSGVRNTIITELQSDDSLELKYSELRTLQGLGEGVSVDAYISQFNDLNFRKITFPSKTVYVLKENYFRFSEQYGTKVNGFLGLDFSKDYVFEINYNWQCINIYSYDGYKAPSNYKSIPIVIKDNKMYIQAVVEYQNREKDTLNLLIDTGAQLNAWLSPAIQKQQDKLTKSIYGRVGDELVLINNEAVFKMSLSQVRSYFKHSTKSKLNLRLIREEGEFDVQIDMTDQLK